MIRHSHHAWRQQYGYPQHPMYNRKTPKSWIFWGFTIAAFASFVHLYVTNLYYKAGYLRRRYSCGYNHFNPRTYDNSWEKVIDNHDDPEEKADDASTQ